MSRKKSLNIWVVHREGKHIRVIDTFIPMEYGLALDDDDLDDYELFNAISDPRFQHVVMIHRDVPIEKMLTSSHESFRKLAKMALEQKDDTFHRGSLLS
jgi:hypothetical protein